MTVLITLMIFAGSALMVFNIIRFYRYIVKLSGSGDWSEKKGLLVIPLILLIFFLVGYVFVGLFGHPDIMMAGILFGGSIFVAIVVNMLEKVTLHIQEQEQLESQLRAAEESSRAKSAFLSNMSHEIRTPMNAILGIDAIALRDEGISPETRAQLLKIDSSARHLLSLINDVLDMSRIETGQMVLRSEPFSMKEVLEQVGTMIQSQCDDKGLNFVREVRGMKPEASLSNTPCCVGDSMKVKQVLINILGNAVKFTPEGGTVAFLTEAGGCCAGDASDTGCRVRFTISDTGAGMDPEYIPKIFEPFTQEDNTSTNKYGGSGLGMAITKSLVDMMGGSISVESERDEGTTFRVEMKFDPVDPEMISDAGGGDTGEADAAKAAEALRGLRILFAEDVDLNAEILEDQLGLEDIDSERAVDGQEAVDMFKSSEPGYYDAILMDMRMPVMDGLEAARTIRALDRQDAHKIPIVALTANAFCSDVQDCLDAGMDAHLSKPVDTEVMLETLYGLIRLRRGE